MFCSCRRPSVLSAHTMTPNFLYLQFQMRSDALFCSLRAPAFTDMQTFTNIQKSKAPRETEQGRCSPGKVARIALWPLCGCTHTCMCTCTHTWGMHTLMCTLAQHTWGMHTHLCVHLHTHMRHAHIIVFALVHTLGAWYL